MNVPRERELLQKAQAGHPDAVAGLLREHQAAIRSYVARLAPDPVGADDLAQEVFLAALRSLDRVDPALGLRPYLLGIARNQVRLAWRNRLRGREISGETLFDALVARLPENEPADRSDRRLAALQECLKRLGPRALDVIMRHYRDEQRCDEIARTMGTTPGNVRSTLTRTRKALRDCMQPRLGVAVSG